MKSCFLSVTILSILFCYSEITHASNFIDSLRTDTDVLSFLRKVNSDLNSDKYQHAELRSTEVLRKDLDCDGMSEKLAINNWEKIDFNKDGRSDLLVMLYWYDYGVYVVIDKGNNQFEFITLSANVFEKCEMAKAATVNSQPLLLFYERKKNAITTDKEPDTLIYKQGDFVEFNRTPANYAIDSVSFRTGYCQGSCPVFTIATDSKGNANYVASTYNPKMGTFTATIPSEKLNEIIELINYLNFKNLSDSYSVTWTDDQTSWLRVQFKDGSIKEIRDYGLKGNFGLRLLYKKFLALRTNTSWK